MNVLVTEDEKTILVTLSDALQAAGYSVFSATTCHEAERTLSNERIDVLVSDIRLPDGDGRKLLGVVKEKSPYTRVIFMTGHATIEDAVKALKEGADDYVSKPFMNEDLVARVNRVSRMKALEEENRELRKKRWGMSSIIGKSDAIRKVLERIATVSGGDYTVLIRGESGTGKEVVARAIHLESPRADKPFVPLSCAAVPESLLEDELFGHEKGAFTDAIVKRPGAFERADGGLLFFDDIDDMPLAVQVKLLRVLEERTFYRLGGRESVSCDVRLVAATKKDLAEHVAAGRFREDLFYRLNVVTVELPPLRERKVDIPLLIEEFLKRYGGGERTVAPLTMEVLLAHKWPGNVRELENAVRRAIALTPDGAVLGPDAFLGTRIPKTCAVRTETNIADIQPLGELMQATEKMYIEKALSATGNNRNQAAKMLGISRKTLWDKMRLLGIVPMGSDEKE
jgi:DNA-binding NtrC family response regulator